MVPRNDQNKARILARYLVCCACSVSGLCPQLALADSDYTTALKKLGSAYYKYSDLDQRAKELEQQYVPGVLKQHGAVVLFAVKLITEKQVTFKWSFE